MMVELDARAVGLVGGVQAQAGRRVAVDGVVAADAVAGRVAAAMPAAQAAISKLLD